MTDAQAWDRVFDVLPARWRVGQPSFDPDPQRPHWAVTAIGPHPGRGSHWRGESPAAALEAPAARLTGAADPAVGTRLEEILRRIRLAYVQGAESEWPGMTTEELAATLGKYTGR